MRDELRTRLAAEIRDWAHVGLIPDTLADRLAERYETPGDRYQLMLKWLGFAAIYFLGMGLLSLLALAGAYLWIQAVVYGVAAMASWAYGARLASDPDQRHPHSGSVLLTVGLVFGYGALSLIYLAAGGSRYSGVFPLFMLLTAVAAVATAYAYRLRWPLLLGVILLFHALGSWHRFAGGGRYLLHLHDPEMMALAGLAVAALGLWHESVLERRWRPLRHHLGFGHLYLIAGLLYVNLSLWMLSLHPGTLRWVLAFTAVGIGQLVAGARLKDSRITGFGVVFLSIDLYTRLFEHTWDHLSTAIFFMVAGALGIAIGYACERHRVFQTAGMI